MKKKGNSTKRGSVLIAGGGIGGIPLVVNALSQVGVRCRAMALR